jgi:F-type H+-transporting ATPase subunit alpha
VPAQLAVLLALTTKAFDTVPIDQMAAAEAALRQAATTIPAEVCTRFETAATLSAADRQTITGIVQLAVAPFQPKPGVAPEAKATPGAGQTRKA